MQVVEDRADEFVGGVACLGSESRRIKDRMGRRRGGGALEGNCAGDGRVIARPQIDREK